MQKRPLASLRFMHLLLLLILISCRPFAGSTQKSLVGLEAGLEGEIRNGSKAPTFIALADWFQSFKIAAKGPASNKPRPARGEDTVSLARLQSAMDATSRQLFIDFLAAEGVRIREFRRALDASQTEVIRQLLRKEVDEMYDIAAALIYNFGRGYRAQDRRTNNKLAELLAKRLGSSWIDVFAKDFLAKAFRERSDLASVKTQLAIEAENYFRALENRYLPPQPSAKMIESATHLVEDALPLVPYRQFVLSLPIPLRYWINANKKLSSKVHRITTKAVHRYYTSKAKQLGVKDPQPGSITFTQRWGSALNLKPKTLDSSAWSRMLAKLFKIDVTICKKCGGDLAVVCAVNKGEEIARYLKHAKIDYEPPARAPPRFRRELLEKAGICGFAAANSLD